MRHTVKVSDKEYTVNTVQKSPTQWTAGGDFNGESLYVQDRSETTALKRWSAVALTKGN